MMQYSKNKTLKIHSTPILCNLFVMTLYSTNFSNPFSRLLNDLYNKYFHIKHFSHLVHYLFFLSDASKFVFVGVVRHHKLDMGKYVCFYSCSGET